MAKKFDFSDNGALLDKAEELFVSGDIDGAFAFLNRAFFVKESAEAMLMYAKLYYEIGAFDFAVQYCMRMRLTDGCDLGMRYEVAALLFKIYFFEGEFEAADVEFEEIKNIEEDADFFNWDFDEFDGIDLFLDEYRNEYPPFHVIDKKEEDTKEKMREAFRYISTERCSEALKILKKDLDTSEFIPQHNMAILCYINLHKYKLAVGIAEKMLQKPEQRLAGALNMINIAIFKRDVALKERFIAELDTMTVDNEDDLEKVIAALIVTGDHASVEKYAAKFLELHPYDFENLYYYACALINQNKKEEAKK
ncbi:MAG: hypothetical protein LBT20_08285, partial [Clostridiales bacterium]|nr:hypothetical protein [Clostridiales bacterium]